jgi:hypothetical protein
MWVLNFVNNRIAIFYLRIVTDAEYHMIMQILIFIWKYSLVNREILSAGVSVRVHRNILLLYLQVCLTDYLPL